MGGQIMRTRPFTLRPIPILTIAFAALMVTSAPAFGQEPDTRPGIAVLPFDIAQLPPTNLAESTLNFVFSNMLLTELNANPAFRIVDRRALLEVMREIDLVGSPNVDVQTQARLGRLVFARYMVGGNYFDNRGNLRLDVRVINVETTEIEMTARVMGDDLLELIVNLAEEVAEGVNLPPLPPDIREARLSRPRASAEQIELYGFAFSAEADGDNDRALELLARGIARWPDYTPFTEMREEILQG
jgi:TolB-like protein